MNVREIISAQNGTNKVGKIIASLIEVGYCPSPHIMHPWATKPPEYNITFVPAIFGEEGMFDFLNPNSNQEDVRQLRFYSFNKELDLGYSREAWKFIPFFLNAKGEIIEYAGNPEEIDELDPIEINLPAETKVVLIAVGPPEKLIEIKNDFKKNGSTSSKICWAVYG